MVMVGYSGDTVTQEVHLEVVGTSHTQHTPQPSLVHKPQYRVQSGPEFVWVPALNQRMHTQEEGAH